MAKLLDSNPIARLLHGRGWYWGVMRSETFSPLYYFGEEKPQQEKLPRRRGECLGYVTPDGYAWDDIPKRSYITKLFKGFVIETLDGKYMDPEGNETADQREAARFDTEDKAMAPAFQNGFWIYRAPSPSSVLEVILN